jgi:acetyl esterase/lipase
MYENNIKILEEKIKAHAFIRDITKHCKTDGSFDYEGNLTQWDEACRDFEKIYLWLDGEKHMTEGAGASYLIFLPAKNADADTILVAHGGGFGIRTGCEGANVAWEFHKRGYHTAILVYRLLPLANRYQSTADMQQAIRILRRKMAENGLGKKLIVMGFSAGAMLAGSCATHYDDVITQDGEVLANGVLLGKGENSRPDLAVISYGAMSAVSFPIPFMADVDLSLFGETEADRFYFATEKHVTNETCPMFIWQTLSDDGRHGMTLAKALQDAGVSYELHIMDGGVHGLALADGENDLAADSPHIHHWVDLCDEWIRMQLAGKSVFRHVIG